MVDKGGYVSEFERILFVLLGVVWRSVVRYGGMDVVSLQVMAMQLGTEQRLCVGVDVSRAR